MFKLDRITAPHVNEVADKMANDINYGTKTVRAALDRIKDDFGVEYALWVMDKASAVVGLDELTEGVE